MKDEVTVYVPLKELKKAGGDTYVSTLNDLVRTKVIKGYERCLAIRVDKVTALRIETILEGLYDLPVNVTHKNFKGDE
jgi:hypothetical protein